MRRAVALMCLEILACGSALDRAAAGSGLSAPTFCGAGERVVFSCSTGTHVASICASETGDAMQYRYGKSGGLELIYPEGGAKPADAFVVGTLAFSGGGGAWLRFNKGAFQYTIFTATGKWGRGGALADASGVAVTKDGKEFVNIPCRGAADSEIGPDLRDKLGLKEAAEEFDIPEAFLPK
jgi:hypothetical protein